MRMIGLIEGDGLDAHQRDLIDEKRTAIAAAGKPQTDGVSEYPYFAQFCSACNTKAVVQMEGCMTCLSCGVSKCG